MNQAQIDYNYEIELSTPAMLDSDLSGLATKKMATMNDDERVELLNEATATSVEETKEALNELADGNGFEFGIKIMVILARYLRDEIETDILEHGEADDTAERESHIIDMQEVAAFRNAA